MLSGLFFSWKGMGCWIELIFLSLTVTRVMSIIICFFSTCWTTTSKWWPFQLIVPTSFSPWTMFLLLVSRGHGRNIWITGISSTWVHCSTKPIFSVFNRAFYSAMSESNIRAGLKNTGINPVNYEAIPTSKIAPSYVTDVLRNDNSKKMLNALHLKILYLRIIVRFLNCVTILCLILYPNCIIELDLFTFHLQFDIYFISKLQYLIIYISYFNLFHEYSHVSFENVTSLFKTSNVNVDLK